MPGTVSHLARYKKGLWAEWLCRMRLRLCGYQIVATRLRTPAGEIDIVAARGRDLAIIEVKARADAATALSSLQPRQQQRIQKAAQFFLSRHPQYNQHNIRFDIMVVTHSGWPRHMANAWQG